MPKINSNSSKIGKRISKTEKDALLGEAKKIMDGFTGLAKIAKDMYENADDKTKKKILSGAASAAAIIAGAIGARRMYKKRKEE